MIADSSWCGFNVFELILSVIIVIGCWYILNSIKALMYANSLRDNRCTIKDTIFCWVHQTRDMMYLYIMQQSHIQRRRPTTCNNIATTTHHVTLISRHTQTNSSQHMQYTQFLCSSEETSTSWQVTRDLHRNYLDYFPIWFEIFVETLNGWRTIHSDTQDKSASYEQRESQLDEWSSSLILQGLLKDKRERERERVRVRVSARE